MNFGKRLRELLATGRIIDAPGVLDAMSARLAAQIGFDCLYMSGYANSAVILGGPDFGLLTLNEMTERVKTIVDASQKPVIADADTGYGNPVNVRRAVAEFIRAGAAGIHLEDQVFPKRCAYAQGMQVAPVEVMVQRIRAAVDTVSELQSDMVIIARTDAREVYGLEEALRRGKLYAKAGADVIYIEAPPDREELATIGRSFEVPLLVDLLERDTTPMCTVAELEELGFSIAIHPLSALFLIHKTLKDFYTSLREEGTTEGWVRRMTSFTEFNEFVGLSDFVALAGKYGASDTSSPGESG